MKMVNKESSEKDPSEKKRRKASNADASTSKHQKEDIYENVISHEEQEALRRSPEKDMALFHHTCDELKKIFEEVAALKKDNSDKAKAEIQEKRIQGSLIFVLLKKLNRLDKVRIRFGRDALHKEKLRVDSNRLQLQNLLYESNHLKREVERCYQFKSQDEEIDLVPEEEFYTNAPESISRPNKTLKDDHARRLARLEWELQQRKQLSALCKDLSVSKENASKDISLKTERLDSLGPCLEALLKATRPLQSALDMNIEKEWEIQKSARLLPRPLYLVYANLSAYSEACMSKLSIVIEGDEEEAKQLEIDEKKDKQKEEVEDISSILQQESDNEDIELNDVRKKHHKRQLSKFEEPSSSDEKLKRLLKYHPLSVTFKITDSMNGLIAVTLRYLPALDFVVAKPHIIMENNVTGIAAGNVISPENVLNCLFSDDYGNVSPNPKTKYQLPEYGISEEKLIQLLSELNIGKPYKWAQKLCGLDFITAIQGPSTSNSTNNRNSELTPISYELAQNSVISIIKLIKSRWHSRLGLYKQIHALENKNIDFVPSNTMTKQSVSHKTDEKIDNNDDDDNNDDRDDDENICNVPIRISSCLVQWITLTAEDYMNLPITQRFIDENLINPADMFYTAIITRGSAKLECFINISSNFPKNIPIWALNLNWNGKHDALNNTAIRDIEHWINSFDIKIGMKRNLIELSSLILSVQLKRCMSCLDIFLETEGPLYNPAEFTQDKTYLKGFRGRTRSRPYKIVQNGGSVFFKQL